MDGAVQSTTAFRGRRISVDVLSVTDRAGRCVTREVVRHPGAVVIVPVLDDGRLVLIRNHRIAVDDRLWELPAGTLEPGEDPADAAGRELQEETGYRPTRIRPLASFFASPGFVDELLHTYVAEGLEHVGQDLDPGEDIEPVALPRAEVLAMIDDGRIRDGKTIAGVLLWERGLSGHAGPAVHGGPDA